MTQPILFALLLLMSVALKAQKRVVAFYTANNDRAHISFVGESIPCFQKMAAKRGFSFKATNDWSLLNESTLKEVDMVLFLDTRIEDPEQRAAFENYMKSGGSWLGFHFAGFALDNSDIPQNWDWYHREFLGTGQYKGNTWRPTSAFLKGENLNHPAHRGLPEIWKSSPNEWYKWELDLRQNPDIDILLSIDSSSFPLGTGPKQHEIWREGYYPVAWSNRRYRMAYVNMGHNDIDYEGGTNMELSFQFQNDLQKVFTENLVTWLLDMK